jgi:tetratricopeptide (TPR) repeat protein
MNESQGFLQGRETDLKGRRQLAALDEIEADFINIREAWLQAVKRGNDAAVGAMIEGLYWFCTMRGRFQDGFTLFGQAREAFAPQPDETPKPIWGRLHVRFIDPTADATTIIKDALALAQTHQDKAEIAFCLHALGTLTEEDSAKQALYAESLTLYRELGDRFYQARVLNDIGLQHLFMSRGADALSATQQSLDLRQAIGDTVGTVTSLFTLGHYRYTTGETIGDRDYYAEANALARQTGHLYELAESNIVLGIRSFGQGNVKTLAEEALRIATDIGATTTRGRALALLASIAGHEADYEHGAHYGTQSLTIAAAHPSDFMLLLYASAAMGQIACGLKNYETAWKHAKTVFEIGTTHNLLHFAVGSLDVAATVLAHRGEKARAVELLALQTALFGHADTDPNAESEWPLLKGLRADLGDTAYVAAWERGTSSDPAAVLAALLTD